MANLSNINNKFLVTTGGNVLIGQTGAVGSSILQVTGNSTFAGDVLVEDNLYLTDTGTVRGKIQLNASDRDDLDIKVVSLGSNIKFFTVDTERMRISSTGDVGIGTTPTVGYNLDVKRTSPGYSIVGRHATGGKVGIYSSTGDNGIGTINNYPMNFFTNNSGPQVTLTTAGNVGINTTTPDQKLQVGGNFHIYDEVGNTDASLFMTTGSSDTTTVKIASNGTSYLNGGNVGIGTTSPTQGKVDILDAGAYSAHTGHGLTINSNANNAYTSMYMGADDSIDAIYIQSAGRNTSFTSKKLLLNPNGGNVGIGTTSPAAPLDVAFADNSSPQRWSYSPSESNYFLELDTNIPTSSVVTYNFNVKNNGTTYNNNLVLDRGNVGIGTTTPNQKLEVSNSANPTISIANSDASFTAGQTIGTLEFSSNNETSLSGAYTPFSKIKAISEINVVGTGSVNGAITFETAKVNTFSERMRIDSSGNVGIGTTSPDCKLTVAGSGSGGVNPSTISSNTVATFRRTGGVSHNANISILAGTSGASILNFGDRDNEDAGIITYTHDSGGSDTMAFTVGTSEKMRIINSGNVGINTTSPNSKLTVSGPATPSLANGENSIRIESHSSAAASPGVLGNGINFAQKWWSGSAGLQVTGGIYGIKNSVNGTYGGGLAFYTQPSSAADMAQRMVINTDGNVGIGVTGPTQLLQLGNTTGARSKGIGLGDVANNLRGIISCDTGTNDLILGSTTNMKFFTGSTFGTIAQLPTNETMSILSNGNVGIGTNSPASVLHIKDNSANPTQLSIQSNDYSRAEEINFLNPSTSAISGQIKYYTNPTVEYMSFSTSNNSAAAERMRITNTGNVGIGTTSPWTKLAVSGTTASNSPSIGRYTTSTTAWTTILTFTNPNNTNNMYSVLLGTSENSYSQMWRVSGSVIQQTCYYTLLGDSNHPHSKDVEFRISSSALQYKNINYSTGRVLYVFDVVQSTGTFTY